MKTILPDMLTLLKNGIDFAVATILDHSGSTPRTAGTKMLILPDGSIRGTIGGGLVEAQVMTAGQALISKKENHLMKFKLHQDLKESLDMICGGALTVFIETVTAEKQSLYLRIAREIENRKKCMLVSELTRGKDGAVSVRQSLITDALEIVGENLIPHSFSTDLIQTHFKKNAPVITDFGKRQLTWEPIAARGSVFLFGGGHVAQKVARLTALLDYPTVIIDDRADFANADLFPTARETHVINHFTNAFDSIRVDTADAVVILTRGHLHDQTVLEQALATDAHYIGMIGSRKKKDIIYKNLRKLGISDRRLETVHCPIGVDIHAETPAEIAVSIAAQIIARRNVK